MRQIELKRISVPSMPAGVKNFAQANRSLLLIALILLGGVGGWIWHTKSTQINLLDSKISDAHQNVAHYEDVIAQVATMRIEYTRLANQYLKHQENSAQLEAEFTDTIAQICKRDKVTFGGANYGLFNGSNPPAPQTVVDAQGNPLPVLPSGVAATVGTPQIPGRTVTELGAGGPGDPASDQPPIPATLFDRIPVTVSFKGQWRQLTKAMSDIAKENVLMSIGDPMVKKEEKDLTLTFSAQILTPAIQILPELIDQKENNKILQGNPEKKKLNKRHIIPKGLDTQIQPQTINGTQK